VLKYLARYTHRVALSNSRLVALEMRSRGAGPEKAASLGAGEASLPADAGDETRGKRLAVGRRPLDNGVVEGQGRIESP
jgi:hypothetical protein